jgi:hypothetical protein
MKNVFKVFGIIALVFGFVLFGCDNGNGTTVEVFTASINDTVSNDVDTLGLIGTSVSSNKPNVATVEIVSGKIKIVSVSEGTALITVSEGSKNATIHATVSKTGSIAIGNIVKYTRYDGQIFHIFIDMSIPAFVEGDPVTAITTGTIRDRRQNNVDANDPNVYINVGSISNNKVTLSLPVTVDNSKLDNETGTYIGNFGSWGIAETGQRLDLMCLSGNFAGDTTIFYSAAAIPNLEYDDRTFEIRQGWNIFIYLFDGSGDIRVAGVEELYEKGFKWYLRPNN